MEKHKIIRVLEFIKDYCNEKNRCNDCPFYKSEDYECNLTRHDLLYPAQWDVDSIKGKLFDKDKI